MVCVNKKMRGEFVGKTYPKVIELMREEFEVKKTTKYSFCKATGINPTSVERYLCGISEPNQASLEKLADYFGVSVAYLRGEEKGLQVLVPSASMKARIREGSAKTDIETDKTTPTRVIEFFKIAVAESSLTDVATNSGVSVSEINQFMDGIGLPSEETLQKLSEFSGLPTDFFLGKGSCPFGLALNYVVEEIRGFARDQNYIPEQEKLELMEEANNIEKSLKPLANTINDMAVEKQIIYVVATLPKERKVDIQKAVKLAQEIWPHDPKIESRDMLFLLLGLLFGLQDDHIPLTGQKK
jgi:transcriptional regulator with XRE-family HTH domain